MITRRRLNSIAVLALAILVLFVGYLAVSERVLRNFEDGLRQDLEETLANNRRAVMHWVDTRKSEATAHAQDPVLRRAANELLAIKDDRQALINAQAQDRLRTFFASFLYQEHVNGYFLIAPDGTSLASSRDSNIGTPNLLLAQPLMFARLLNGEPLLTSLMRSDVSVVDSNDIRENVTNFAAAPLRDDSGQVIAILALRLFPERELFRLMGFVEAPDSAAIYAFNRRGALLTRVSDLDLMRQRGIWRQGQDHLLLQPENNDRYPPHLGRLVLPVRQALRGYNASDIAGYHNYAGDKVVGAWHYFDDLNFGVITEQPYDEAFAPAAFLHQVTLAAFAICSTVVVLIFWWMMMLGRRMEANRRRLAATLNASQDVNFLIDTEGRIQLANAALKSLFGVAPELGIGQSITRFVDLGNRREASLRRGALRALARETQQNGLLRCEGICDNGSRKPIAIQVEPLSNDQTSALEYLVVVHDYSAVERREKELQDALRRAESGSRTKSSFLSTISHELRSPLLSVIAALELLAERAKDDDDRSLLVSSQRSGQLLLGLIDDILDYSRMEADNLELTQQDVNLERILSDVIAMLKWQAHANDVALVPFCDPYMPIFIGDGLRLRQIILNLMSNAIKFSANMRQPGRVEVSLRSQPAGDGQMYVILTVRDNGIGMTQDTMQQIFQPFTQADGTIRRKFGGTGLGLTISDRLIKMMGGHISVMSDPGSGTEFEVKLPLDVSKTVLPRAKPLDQKQILINARNSDIADSLTRYVHSAGGRSQTVKPAALDAAGIAKLPRPDLIVLEGNSQAPRPDDALLSAFSEVPVLAIAPPGNRRPDLIEASETRGIPMAGLPTSAVLPSEIIANIVDLLGDAAEGQDQIKDTEQDRRLLLVEDDDMTREITLRMLNQLGIPADAVINGEEGLNQWRSGRYSMLLSDCHMPIMDGFQMASEIRAEEGRRALPKTPIIAVSADMTMEIERLCQDSQIDEYVPKPLTPGKLRTLLQVHMPGSLDGTPLTS